MVFKLYVCNVFFFFLIYFLLLAYPTAMTLGEGTPPASSIVPLQSPMANLMSIAETLPNSPRNGSPSVPPARTASRGSQHSHSPNSSGFILMI